MHGSLPGLAAGRFGVIMFFSACRLPSFAPEDPPSHASENQITTGLSQALNTLEVDTGVILHAASLLFRVLSHSPPRACLSRCRGAGTSSTQNS